MHFSRLPCIPHLQWCTLQLHAFTVCPDQLIIPDALVHGWWTTSSSHASDQCSASLRYIGFQKDRAGQMSKRRCLHAPSDHRATLLPFLHVTHRAELVYKPFDSDCFGSELFEGAAAELRPNPSQVASQQFRMFLALSSELHQVRARKSIAAVQSANGKPGSACADLLVQPHPPPPPTYAPHSSLQLLEESVTHPLLSSSTIMNVCTHGQQ